ncbi:hypothetical protein GCM10028798_27340 [Humibacter antri]
MSAIGAVPTRGFVRERAAISIGRALVSWGERRQRLETERQALYRRQYAADQQTAVRAGAVRGQLLP